MKIKMKLNQNSIKQAISDLNRYKSTLHAKNELFIEKLLEVGITIANHNRGRYANYISFEKKVEGSNDQVIGILSGMNSGKCTSWWYYKGGKKEVEINALAMAEFGSGWLAEVLFDITGVGQGTFPGQKHAYDDAWYWVDDKGLHVSQGELPQHPFYNAEMQMIEQIELIAKEVFGSDI